MKTIEWSVEKSGNRSRININQRKWNSELICWKKYTAKKETKVEYYSYMKTKKAKRAEQNKREIHTQEEEEYLNGKICKANLFKFYIPMLPKQNVSVFASIIACVCAKKKRYICVFGRSLPPPKILCARKTCVHKPRNQKKRFGFICNRKSACVCVKRIGWRVSERGITHMVLLNSPSRRELLKYLCLHVWFIPYQKFASSFSLSVTVVVFVNIAAYCRCCCLASFTWLHR